MAAPTVTLWTPTGLTEDPDVNVSVRVFDNDSDHDTSTIFLDLTAPDTTVHNVIINGVFQVGSGFNGTINTVGKEIFIALTTHPYFEVGVWTADFSCKDLAANSAAKIWNFTVTADSPTITNQDPIGVKTGTMDKISFVINDDWGIDSTTLDFDIISPTGETFNAIIGGAFQTGFTGVIIEHDLDSDTFIEMIEVIVNTWLDLDNGSLYTFAVDCDTVVGTSL